MVGYEGFAECLSKAGSQTCRVTDADFTSAVSSLAGRLSLFGVHVDAGILFPAVERVAAIPRDQPIWAERDHSNRIFVLESGFAFAFSLYPDGRRHIGDIFASGALCNWSSVWGGMLVEDVIFQARSRVIVLDRGAPSGFDRRPAAITRGD